MQVSLLCPCGHSIVADHTMAGTLITCQCGRRLDVPSLREMKRQAAEYSGSVGLSTGAEPGFTINTSRPIPVPHAPPTLSWMTCGMAYVILKVMLATYIGLAAVAIVFGGWIGLAGAIILALAQISLAAQMYSKEGSTAVFVLIFPIVGLVAAISYLQEHFGIAQWLLFFVFLGMSVMGVGVAMRLAGLT